MNYNQLIFFLVFGFYQISPICAYKPVAIIHGFLDKPRSLDYLSNYIRMHHPGTNVTVINLYHGWQSLAPLWKQVEKFGQVVAQISAESKGSINVIGYSQGGLVARGILSTFSNLTVDTFISLSAPQLGQYGEPWYIKWLFPNHVKKDLYKVLYTKFGQQTSLGNYWNDPHHQDLYKKFSAFLAILNNDTYNPLSKQWKENFLKINRLVLVGGPDDGIITPWQSSQFEYYDENEHIIGMSQQKVFKEDTFGLATLHQRKDIANCVVSGVNHFQFHSNLTVFNDCILPWLT